MVQRIHCLFLPLNNWSLENFLFPTKLRKSERACDLFQRKKKNHWNDVCQRQRVHGKFLLAAKGSDENVTMPFGAFSRPWFVAIRTEISWETLAFEGNGRHKPVKLGSEPLRRLKQGCCVLAWVRFVGKKKYPWTKHAVTTRNHNYHGVEFMWILWLLGEKFKAVDRPGSIATKKMMPRKAKITYWLSMRILRFEKARDNDIGDSN